MSETITQQFNRLLEGDDVFEQAKRIAERVKAAGHVTSSRIAREPAEKELNDYDANACFKSAAMIAKLSTEVTRLRLLIQHFDHGQIDRRTMVDATRNWNGDKNDKSLSGNG